MNKEYGIERFVLLVFRFFKLLDSWGINECFLRHISVSKRLEVSSILESPYCSPWNRTKFVTTNFLRSDLITLFIGKSRVFTQKYHIKGTQNPCRLKISGERFFTLY